jgi:putative transposase
VGKKNGPNPTDRAKSGTKRSLLVDGEGVPVGLTVSGANRNDHLLLAETFESIPVPRPQPTKARPQGLCLDKGYDYAEPRLLAELLGLTLHLRTRGEEKKELKRKPGTRARRWVVERTHSWLNRFRRILVRWEVREDTYLGMLHLVCGIIAWRASGLLE